MPCYVNLIAAYICAKIVDLYRMQLLSYHGQRLTTENWVKNNTKLLELVILKNTVFNRPKFV